jgi:succinate dehydrogenase/fumarate reductase flavoprotein subunit
VENTNVKNWDHGIDLLVAGSGGGGMTAALVAKMGEIEALVLEKTEFFGGSRVTPRTNQYTKKDYT